MKQKINFRLIAIAVLAVITTMSFLSYVYYGLFQEQIRNDIRVEAELLAAAGVSGLAEGSEILDEKDIRITWISGEGRVLFDNGVNTDALDNHMDRPEVQDAFLTGNGESERKSDTLKLRTYYYALLLDDGTVIRVAKEAKSVFSIFISTFPVLTGILVIILLLCISISHFLTKQLLSPIREMAENMDDCSDKSTYKELSPFIDRIREQHDDILASAKARQDFTANVSHELKTPLTAISGYAELIESRMVDQEQQIQFAGAIRKNADRLVTLINDIIRLSELDQSSIPVQFAKVDLYEIAQERVELLQNNTREKQIKLTLEGGSCELTASRGMMVELLDNLIQNAIHYNVTGGSVEVTVKRSGNHAVLAVSDTGIGIPEDEQPRVFERFYRVDKSRSRDTGGTGLGLSIVKHIVELHEGTIRIQSRPGQGTVITVEL